MDSTKDTLLHIKRVSELLTLASKELLDRGVKHDASKLTYPEKEVFDEVTPKLKSLTYGTNEYKEQLLYMQSALNHHYKNNSHHPEHYKEGINGMDLFDIIEMLLDWKAAGERHDDGCIYKSLIINKERFNISDQLYDILKNTVERYL